MPEARSDKGEDQCKSLIPEREGQLWVSMTMESAMHRCASLFVILFLLGVPAAVMTVFPQQAYADGCGGQGH